MMTNARRFFPLATLLLLTSCDVDKTEAGSLPDVDIEGGELPEYDVEWADVDVGMETTTVTVPKLQVVMEEETVEVPSIDVDMPNDADDAERVRRAIRASALVEGSGYDLEIRSIHQKNDTLYVVSRLEGTPEGSEKEIVSDTVILNAPELDVRHVIVGDRPADSYNDQYRYIASEADLEQELRGSRKIYTN